MRKKQNGEKLFSCVIKSRKGGIGADLVRQMNYKDDKTSSKKMGWPSWYWNAIKKDPLEYLGPNGIPGTPEWERIHAASTKIFDNLVKLYDSQN